MKKITLIVIALLANFSVMLAQDAQPCPCEFENDLDALYAVAEQQSFSYNIENSDPITVGAAMLLAKAGLEAYKSLPSASYALMVISGGEVAYSTVPSCQIALEKAYYLLQLGAEEVRIVSEHLTLNGSCRNKAYRQSDMDDLRERKDGWGHIK